MPYTPSETRSAINVLYDTDISSFVWGSPGIAKSAIVRSIANARGVAVLDMRLSQMRPEDLRGVPYPLDYGGVKGLSWVAPYILPRDLDFSQMIEIEAEETLHKFWNPRSTVNNIFYCTSPVIEAKPLNQKHKVTIRSVADADGVYLYDRCLVELTDDNGEVVGGKVRISVTGKTRVLWALEEFNSAPLGVQAACYELILDRRIGEYVVPKGVQIVALGNLETDKGITYKMPTPVCNRFEHLFMRHDYEEWNQWAINAHIHPLVVAYLAKFTEDLFRFDPSSADKAFPTPRSWEMVSKTLYQVYDENGEPILSHHVRSGLIEGAIGTGVGTKFVAFQELADKLPNLDRIFDGTLVKHEFDPENRMQLSYALVTQAWYRARERLDLIKKKFAHADAYKKSQDYEIWLAEVDRFVGFAATNMSPDVATMGIRLGLKNYGLPLAPAKQPNVMRWIATNSAMVMAAKAS